MVVVALYFFDFFEEREGVVRRVAGVVEELFVAFVAFCESFFCSTLGSLSSLNTIRIFL